MNKVVQFEAWKEAKILRYVWNRIGSELAEECDDEEAHGLTDDFTPAIYVANDIRLRPNILLSGEGLVGLVKAALMNQEQFYAKVSPDCEKTFASAAPMRYDMQIIFTTPKEIENKQVPTL